MCVACSQPKNSDIEDEIASIRAQLLEIAEMSSVDRPTAELTNEYMTYFSKEPTLLPANREAINGRDAIAAFYNDGDSRESRY